MANEFLPSQVGITRAQYEIMRRMEARDIKGMRYTNIKNVERMVEYDEIKKTYGIKKGFAQYMRHLKAPLGLVDDHGKSMEVLSLSNLGAYMVSRITSYEENGKLDMIHFKGE